MSSVTKRISEIKQPRGGYSKPSKFHVKVLLSLKQYLNKKMQLQLLTKKLEPLTVPAF